MKRRTLAAVIFGAGLAVSTIVGPGVAAAPGQEVNSKDSVSKPFFQTIRLSGPCGKDFLRTVSTKVKRTPTESDQKLFYVGLTQDSTGTLKTEEWARNSYNQYSEFRMCRSHKLSKLIEPTNYVHKIKFINYYCDPWCVPTFWHTTGWLEQYCSAGSNDTKVCYW